MKTALIYFSVLFFGLGPFMACVILTGTNSELNSRLEKIEKEQVEFHGYIKDNLTEIYLLYSQTASRNRTIMNMIVRNYHHIAGHEDVKPFCPECFDLVRRKGEPVPAEEIEGVSQP